MYDLDVTIQWKRTYCVTSSSNLIHLLFPYSDLFMLKFSHRRLRFTRVTFIWLTRIFPLFDPLVFTSIDHCLLPHHKAHERHRTGCSPVEQQSSRWKVMAKKYSTLYCSQDLLLRFCNFETCFDGRSGLLACSKWQESVLRGDMELISELYWLQSNDYLVHPILYDT